MGKITKNIFRVDNDTYLEDRMWYRFLRILNYVGYGFVLLVIIVAYFGFKNATTYQGEGLTCPDGSKWIVTGMTSPQKCGLCYHRTDSTPHFVECNYLDPHYYDNVLGTAIYKPTYSTKEAAIYGIIIGLVGFIILKVVVNTVVYIAAGKKVSK